MSWLDDIIGGASKAVDVYAKVQTIKRSARPPVRRPVRRPAPIPRRTPAPVAPKQSFVQQNQKQLLAVAGLLALLLVVKKR